jgi:hypothetical protein
MLSSITSIGRQGVTGEADADVFGFLFIELNNKPPGRLCQGWRKHSLPGL